MGCVFYRDEKSVKDLEFLILESERKYISPIKNQNIERALPIAERSIIYSDEESHIFKKIEKRKILYDSINSSFIRSEGISEENRPIRIREENKNRGKSSKRYSSDNSFNSKSKRESLFKSPELRPLITENDLFFEEIFRRKLLKKAEEENYMLNLIHLEELKIPFPEELEKFDDDLYTSTCIEEIKNKLKGKFRIEKGLVDTISVDNIMIFINRKEEDPLSDKKSILLENNFLSSHEIFKNYVGINFKKINKENYAIYYLFAIEEVG